MTADAWVWASFGLLLALLGARAWVVETGHATLGRTPVKVKVLTGACGLAVTLVVGLVAVKGGARLVYLVLHPEVAQALEDARNAADASTEAGQATLQRLHGASPPRHGRRPYAATRFSRVASRSSKSLASRSLTRRGLGKSLQPPRWMGILSTGLVRQTAPRPASGARSCPTPSSC